jgi:hypothetical protein
MRYGKDPVQDVVDRLAQMAKETANETIKARGAIRAQLTLLSTRSGPTACRIQSSYPGR